MDIPEEIKDAIGKLQKEKIDCIDKIIQIANLKPSKSYTINMKRASRAVQYALRIIHIKREINDLMSISTPKFPYGGIVSESGEEMIIVGEKSRNVILDRPIVSSSNITTISTDKIKSILNKNQNEAQNKFWIQNKS